MKKYLILVYVLCSVYCLAQTHRFIYDVQIRKDSTRSDITKENYHLDINGDEILYYSRDFFLADSLIANNAKFPETKLNTSNIIHHKIGSNSYEEYDILESTVLKLKTNESQNWILSPEKKTVKNLKLQKATASWGGRNWTAWFSTDYPFQEGPDKFRGLPGMIVELYDDKDNYKFELAKSENLPTNTDNQFIMMAVQMSVPVDIDKYKKAKLAYYESPTSYIRNGYGGTGETFFLNDGTVVNSKNIREIEEVLKNNVRKYNNPIDLTKAIKYPK